MAETSVPPYKFDEVAFTNNITLIKQHQMSFQGKKGHNPFLWLHTELKPWEDKFLKGERTQALFDAITKMAAAKDIPLAKGSTTEPEVQPAMPRLQPQGIKLPPVK